MTRETIVLVPGAWLTPAFYEPFLNAVSKAGHAVHCAEYPSLDPVDPTTADCKSDADAIAETLHCLIKDEGRDILLVLYSYAGMLGAAAARGLSKAERVKQGKSGGVVRMVFIAAFIVPEWGLELHGGSLPDWVLLDKPLPNLNVPSDPATTFAADVDSKLVCKITDNVKPHSTLAFNSPSPAPAWLMRHIADGWRLSSRWPTKLYLRRRNMNTGAFGGV